MMHLIYPPHFCITIVLDFSWEDGNTQEKLEQRLCKILGASKVHYGLGESGEILLHVHVTEIILCC